MIPAPTLSLSGTARIGAATIFGPLAIEAQAGRWTCLLGPSGVGKSTVLRLFAGLGDGIAFSGRITEGLRGRVALMAQSDLLLPWCDVMGNVTLGARLRGESPPPGRAHDILARVGLAEHATRRPANLSGGQRQRVALARTLMEDRGAVLLDEPFSALDARARAAMQDLSAELLAGRTVLHVTHDTAEAARLGHRVLLMTRAGIADVPTPAAAPPRPFDAPETLAFHARLLRLMMGAG